MMQNVLHPVHRPIHGILIANIALDDLDSLGDWFQIAHRTCRKTVQYPNLLPVTHKPPNNVRADKPGAPGNKPHNGDPVLRVWPKCCGQCPNTTAISPYHARLQIKTDPTRAGTLVMTK
jgi:hypothetical protein